MKYLIIILGINFMFFNFCPIEKGWKGITNFQTNREDVEKILGKPAKEDKFVFYEKDTALVRIIYSEEPCSNTKKFQGSYNVPKNTVIKYSVILSEPIKLSDFNWEKEFYDRFEDPHLRGIVHYTNLKNAVSLTTSKSGGGVEYVGIIDFDSTKELQTKYACPSVDEKIK